MLFFYDYNRGLKLRSYADGAPIITQYSYKELLERTADTGAAADGPRHQEMEQQEEGLQQEKAAAAPQNGTETVIDGECREIGDCSRKGGNSPAPEFTDEEIKHAINYFDTEYIRMRGLHRDTEKQRDYRIALGCIRKCHKRMAEQADRENYGV